jgi:hypothetical protein
MNIGGRIDQKLSDLRWERKDLLEKVPELSVQSLSALIKRDSKRSELDEDIAKALGVSVLWLVYGHEDELRIEDEYESLLLNAFRKMQPIEKVKLIAELDHRTKSAKKSKAA